MFPLLLREGSGLPHILDAAMLVLLSSGVCERLENMGGIVFLRDFGFDMALGYTACCRSRDFEGMQCTSS